MSIFEAIFLGIVQGFSEFLPISSSGHLVLFQKIFNIEEGALSFDIALHFATLVAVVAVYWKKIIEMIRRPFSKLPMYIVLGTIPIGIFGLLFNDIIESFFKSGATLGVGFIFTGIVLACADTIGEKTRKFSELKIKDPLVIGTAQAVAMLPAISRSGMTISSALALGIERRTAADFSFLLSIPAILAAVVLDLYKMIQKGENTLASIGMGPVVIGMLFSAICGFIAVKVMLKLISNKKLHCFSYYLWVVGGLVLLDQLVLHRFF